MGFALYGTAALMILLFLHVITLLNSKYLLHIWRESWLIADWSNSLPGYLFISLYHLSWREFHFVETMFVCRSNDVAKSYILYRKVFLLNSYSNSSNYWLIVGSVPISNVHIACVMLIQWYVHIVVALTIIPYLSED